jgi:UDP-N-acetylmuramate dehydrogenase
MKLERNVSLKDYCTLNVGGTAVALAHITTRDELVEAVTQAKTDGLEVFVLGSGSNIVFTDEPLKKMILKIEIEGFETVAETDETTTIKIGAGEIWDQVVKRCVEEGLAGLESLSMIPGTVGGTPVQNVGAYGHEVSEVITEVEVYNLEKQAFETLSKADCKFGYRSSIFKTSAVGKYVICSVSFELEKNLHASATYQSLISWLDKRHIQNPTIAEIREGVMAIRSIRLPDPSVVPNVGSFFKNPIVEPARLAELQKTNPDIPSFPFDGKVKLQAGWLIEQCGLKGQAVGKIVVYDKNALVLTNPNHAGFGDLEEASAKIIKLVNDMFGVTLETEPQFIS